MTSRTWPRSFYSAIVASVEADGQQVIYYTPIILAGRLYEAR